MTVFRVQSHNGDIFNTTYPRRDVMGLLDKKIAQFPRPPRISIQLPAHHQTTPFAMSPNDKNTLVIDFRWLGYAARLRTLPDFSTPYEKAGSEAEGLARLINGLRKIAPDCPVDVVAHRLGARVAILAVRIARSKMWRNLLLTNAFEYSARTLVALDCPMGRHLNFHNIITHQNNITSLFFDRFGPKPGPADRAICFGYKFAHSNWSEVLDTDLAATRLLLAMGANTFALTAPHRNPVINIFGRSLSKV